MKLSGLVIGAVGLFCLTVASARAAEVLPPEERLELELHAKRGFVVYASLSPQKHVAVVDAQRNPDEALQEKGLWMGAAYAAHAPAASLAGRVNVHVGGVAHLQGRFISSGTAVAGHESRSCRGRRPLTEQGAFVGKIAFRGDGGYLRLIRRRARAFRMRSFRLRCRPGHAGHPQQGSTPGLFGYIGSPIGISNRDGTFLTLERVTRSRIIGLLAVHRLFEESSRIEAVVKEWLPGKVATTRWVEASGLAESSFQVDESERHPRTAILAPPFPFSGEASYGRKQHALHGDLRVSLLGKSLRVAGHVRDDHICRRTPKMATWVCR